MIYISYDVVKWVASSRASREWLLVLEYHVISTPRRIRDRVLTLKQDYLDGFFSRLLKMALN